MNSPQASGAPVAPRALLLAAFDQLLQPEGFKDYGPNGLQVEGKAEVRKIVSGVTASLALIEAAVAAQADAIFVHHGLFWRGQDGRVTGWMKQRLALLLAHDINLYAYHLPLDAHPELGNNAQLGLQLGLKAERYFGENKLGFLGGRSGAVEGFDSADSLALHVRNALNRPVILVGNAPVAIKNIASVNHWPRVEIVMNYAGASGALVDALLVPVSAAGAQGQTDVQLAQVPVRGLVVAGTGNGTIHQDLEAALRRAQALGVRVVRSTRCATGRVLATESSEFAHSKGLSPVKARIALMLELMQA